MKALLQLVLISFISTLSVTYADNLQGVEIQHYRDPYQKVFSYAGKLYWDARKRQWHKKIVVYNNAPTPTQSHPVWQYVAALKVPNHAGVKGKDLFYKRFYEKNNCTEITPLTLGRPWHINFDSNKLGRYDFGNFRKDWNCPEWKMGLNLVDMIKGGEAYRGNSMRIHYLKGIAGCYSPKHCVNWKPKLGKKFQQLFYGYRFKFPRGFTFVKGGKLPGIGGGKANTNGNVPNGSDGWSVRMMWDKEGKLVQYVYHPDQPRKYGDSMAFDMQPLELGQWHTIQTMVRLNQPGKYNGAIKTWLDGKLVLNKQDMRFRNNHKLEIDQFLFASFFGGGGPHWAPKRDLYAYIDDIRISPSPVFYQQ